MTIPQRLQVACNQTKRKLLRHSSHLLPLVIILVVGSFLRFYMIGDESLWQDESTSHAFANLPIDDLLGERGQAETNPPLYYVLLHIWIGIFGDSEASLRTPSAIFSVLSLIFTYLAGLWLMGRSAGIIAASISAVMVHHVHYAQEARAYALMLLGATIAVAGFSRLLRNPNRAGKVILEGFDWKSWGLYILGTSTVLYSHNAGVFLPSSLTIAAVLAFCFKPKHFGKGFALNWLIANTLVIAIWLPWILILLRQVSDISSFWIEMPDLVSIIRTPIQLYIPTHGLFRSLSKLTVCLAGLAFGVFCIRNRRWDLIFTLGLLTGGVFVQAYIASLFQPIFILRIFVWTLPMFALILAIGTVSLPKKTIAYGLAGCLIMTNILGLYQYYKKPEKESWNQLVEVLKPLNNEQTLKILRPADIITPLSYYLDNTESLHETSLGVVNKGEYVESYGSDLVHELVASDDVASAVVNHDRLLIIVRLTRRINARQIYSVLESEFEFNTRYKNGNLSVIEAIRIKN